MKINKKMEKEITQEEYDELMKDAVDVGWMFHLTPQQKKSYDLYVKTGQAEGITKYSKDVFYMINN